MQSNKFINNYLTLDSGYNNPTTTLNKYTSSVRPKVSNFNLRPLDNVVNYKPQVYSSTYNNGNPNRSMVDRFFDGISAVDYATMGAIRGVVRDDLTVMEGITGGLKAGNMFGGGYEAGEHRFSDVLGDIGWNPETKLGKAGKFAVGLAGDIFLSPTTYISGGLGGVLKGTGKAGTQATKISRAVKTAEKLGIHVGDDVLEELAEGVYKANKAKHAGSKIGSSAFADKIFRLQSDDIARNLHKEIGFDEAYELIKARSKDIISPDELTSYTNRFLKKYNELRGVTGAVADRTLSLKHAPFGKKIFGELAEKELTLIKGETLQKIGDKTFSRAFYTTRDYLMGSKLGEMFSTSSSLYNLSKKDPGAVYDTLIAMDIVRGNTKNMKDAGRIIHAKAKEFNFTPEETEQIIALMEDKTVWGKFKQLKNYTETQDGMRYKQKIKDSYENTKKSIDELSTEKKLVDALLTDENVKIDGMRETLEEMRSDYRKKLQDVNLSQVKDKEEVKQLLNLYNEDANLLEGKLKTVQEVFQKDVNVVKTEKAEVIYNWVAKKMGFNNPTSLVDGWDDVYTKPMQQAIGAGDEYAQLRLAKLKHNRDNLISKFSGASTTADINKILREDANSEFVKDFINFAEAKSYSNVDEVGRIGRSVDKDKANALKNVNNTLTSTNSPDNLITKQAKDDITLAMLESDGVVGGVNKAKYNKKVDIQNALIERNVLGKGIDASKLTPKVIQQYSSLSDEVTVLLDKLGLVDNFDILDENVKALVIAQAENNVKLNKTGIMLNLKKSDKAKEILRTKHSSNKEIVSNLKSYDELESISPLVKSAREGVEETVEQLILELSDDVDVSKMNRLKVIKDVDDDLIKQIEDKNNIIRSMGDTLTEDRKQIVSELKSLKAERVKVTNEANELLSELDSAHKLESIEYEKGYFKRVREMKKNIEEHQKGWNELYKSIYDSSGKAEVDKLATKIKHYEDVLSTDEAMEIYAKQMLGEGYVNKMIDDEAVEQIALILDDGVEISTKVKNTVEYLRASFLEMGQKEAIIGKLTPEQYDNMMFAYLPHILTEDGHKLFAKDEVLKRIPGFGDNLGFGRSFNQFGIERTFKNIPDGNGGYIANPTIRQANEFLQKEFNDVLKGRNAFNEDIADIFMQRALKHNELMYDDHYMRTMGNVFGNELATGTPREGYKAVVNFGELRESVQRTVSDKVNGEIRRMSARFGKEFSPDEIKIMRTRHTKEYLRSVGLDERILEDLAIPFVELDSVQLQAMQKTTPSLIKEVSGNIVDKVNLSRKLQIQKDQSSFLSLFDRMTYLIKLNQTTVLPSFHVRNFISNKFNSALKIGADAVDIDFQTKAYRALTGGTLADDVLDIYKDGARVDRMTWEEIFTHAKEWGVVDEGFFAVETGASARGTGVLRDWGVSPKFDPTDAKNFIGYKTGSKIGGQIENQDRLVHFASMLKNGASIEEASESVTKFLFDYSDLTAFEKSTMKRIIPYYTWMKKNTALQLEMMMSNPGKYRMVSKVMGNIETLTPKEDRVDKAYVNDFAQDWLQLPFSVKNPEGRREPVLLNPNLPFGDLNNIPTSIGGGLTDFVTKMNPLIKVPLELAMNKNVFFDQDIVDDEDTGRMKAIKRADYAMSQLSPYTTAKGFIEKRGVDRGLHALNSISGIKALSYDYDKFKAIKIGQQVSKKRREIEEKNRRNMNGIN